MLHRQIAQLLPYIPGINYFANELDEVEKAKWVTFAERWLDQEERRRKFIKSFPSEIVRERMIIGIACSFRLQRLNYDIRGLADSGESWERELNPPRERLLGDATSARGDSERNPWDNDPHI